MRKNISFIPLLYSRLSYISQCNINVVNIIDTRMKEREEFKHTTEYLWDFLSGYKIDVKKKFLDMPNILIAGCTYEGTGDYLLSNDLIMFFLFSFLRSSWKIKEISEINDHKVVNEEVIFYFSTFTILDEKN